MAAYEWLMSNAQSPSLNSENLAQNRGWLILGGILTLFVGFSAMTFPMLYTILLARLLGWFALVSGVLALVLAIRGKQEGHRLMEGLLGIIRIGAGIAMLACVTSSVKVITLILAIFLFAEGISLCFSAFSMRLKPGWFWVLINGIASLALGLMVYAGWPSSGVRVLGLLLGINLLMHGFSLLALGLSARKPAAA